MTLRGFDSLRAYFTTAIQTRLTIASACTNVYNMDQLANIGFYTLSDARVRGTCESSPLWRAELLLTDKCNFKCPYCRGVDSKYAGALSAQEAARTLELWLDSGLQNVRFSGGEPLLWPGIERLVARCAKKGVKRIAISSNGSIHSRKYEQLTALGVNDWSISLDACCASTGDNMAGGIPGAWERVIENIRLLAKLTYVTVGVVLTEANVDELHRTVLLAHELGVADIRIISAAQYNVMLRGVEQIPNSILSAHPILKYRVENLKKGDNVRGMSAQDYNRCAIVLDDMAAVGGFHFPCIIYLREGGQPIGRIGAETRRERARWAETHDTFKDPICKANCLDVCRAMNNRYRDLRVSRLAPDLTIEAQPCRVATHGQP